MYEGRNSANDEIRSHLDSGEKLHWSGQPYQGFSLSGHDALLIPFGLFFLGFSIFWELMALKGVSEGAPTFFPIFGIPFILVGLYLVFGRFYYDKLRRKNTYYGITNKRIIIVHGIFRKGITSHDIHSLPALSIDENTDGTGTIQLSSSSGQMPKIFQYQLGMWPGMMDKTDQLEQIEDARDVFNKIKQIKED